MNLDAEEKKPADPVKPVTAQAADPILFAKPTAETTYGLAAGSISFSPAISSDGRSVELIFDGSMEFSIDSHDSNLTKTWTAAVQVPQTFKDNPPTIVYLAIVRGFITKAAAVRVALTLDLGGVTQVVNFPTGKAISGEEWQEDMYTPIPEIQVDSTSAAGNPTTSTKPLYLSYYPIVITITVQRATPQDEAVVQVESINIETLTPHIVPTTPS